MKQTDFFLALADETRLRALLLIAAEGELCICELTQALATAQPKMSRHMASLREAGLVSARRHAQWVFYGLDPQLADWQRRIVEAAIEGASGNAQALADRQRLAAMQDRPVRCAIA
jgi:ArsR family transcriptional regulator